MRPITETIPKAMIEVAGEPFIAHQLRKFAREGVTRALLCVSYLAEQIEDYVGDGSRLGVAVTYVPDGPKLLGTGGALRQALPHLGERFFVTWGDTYLDVAYPPILAAFEQSGAPALMTVLRNEGRWDKSNVVFADGRVLRYDKKTPSAAMHHIDYGLLLFRRDAIERIPADASYDLADLQHALSLSGELAGYEVSERFYEIGSPDGLAETDAHLRAQGKR
jgi:NDP-sugar pyrophosphorylase family protein